MTESTYTAYDCSGNTVKAGVVTHVPDKDNDFRGPVNFLEAVIADVGEDRFENEVAGIRD